MPLSDPDFQQTTLLVAGLVISGFMYGPFARAAKPPTRYDKMSTQQRMKTLKDAHDPGLGF